MNALGLSFERLFDVVDYLVDDRVGVIRDVIEVKKAAGDPDIFCFYARACDTKAWNLQANFADAAGASSDRRFAMAKAIGEAVERYCAAVYEANELPFVSYDSAQFRCISPDQFALYNQHQYSQPGFPYLPFEGDTPLRWTPALNLATEDWYYLPAAMIFAPYLYDEEGGEPPIVQPISTGLACHCSKNEAAISAICEVVERDAFTIAWQARLAMPQIAVETLTDTNRDLVDRFEQNGTSVVILNITMDHGVPTILSVLRNQASESPALVFAAAAHLNPEYAVRKSLEELALTRRLAQDLKSYLPPLELDADFKNVISQNDHIHLFCDQRNSWLADFVFASKIRIDFRDIPNIFIGKPEVDLRTLVKKINSVNHEIFLADLTTPDIEQLGLWVVRAVIPGFHPLFFGHRFRALGGHRLWQIPEKLGHRGITPDSGDNPIPHPYP